MIKGSFSRSKPILNKTYINRLCLAIFALFSFYLLQKNDYVWKWVESLSLFTTDVDFLHRFLQIPGGLLSYIGCYLTQLLYYPILGSIFFVGLLCTVQQLTYRAFRFTASLYLISFLPSFMLLTSVLNVGYTWVTLKSPGHFFVPVLGCILFLTCLIIYRHIKLYYLRILAIALIIIAYPLFGFYALFTASICLLYEWQFRENKIRQIAMLIVGLFSVWLIPKLYYFTINSTEQEFSRIYVAGLPSFFIRHSELMLWVPFLILFSCYILFAIFPLHRKKECKSIHFYISLLFYFAAVIFTIKQMYQNENFESSVRSNLAIDNANWTQVLDAAYSVKGSPTRDVVINERIALMQLGKPLPKKELPPLLPVYKDSRPGIFTFMQLCGLSMHYYMGQINLCYRWSMELSVEYGWRVSCLKYMVKCSLVNGELNLAQKYNDILKKTAFHKSWAEEYQQYIDYPERMKLNKEFISISGIHLPDTFIE